MIGKLMLLSAALLSAYASLARAEQIVHPSGLAFDPPEELDVTWQPLPELDLEQHVFAFWKDDKLIGFTNLEEVGASNVDAAKFVTEVARELQKSLGKLNPERQVTYAARDSLTVTAAEVTHKRKDGSPGRLILNHLTDRKTAYFGTLGVVDTGASEQVFDLSVALFRTAGSITKRQAAVKDEWDENALVGRWKAEADRPGRPHAVVSLEMRDDMTFATTAKIGGKVSLEATGLWTIIGSEVRWTYLRSKPDLPDEARVDEDTLLVVSVDEFRTKSSRTGEVTTFSRVR
ncbi:MAG: hypothetical protein ABW136_12785 [Steroidobacteraceae bacterium]